MKQLAAFFGAFVLFMSALAAGESHAASEQQWAYDACRKSYSDFRGKESFGAMVSGQDDKRTSCFRVWGRSSQSQATADALEDCRKRYSRCHVFATSSGLRDWAAKISRMGGNDGTKGSGGSNGGEAAAAFVQGLIGGISAVRGSGGSGGGGYSSGGSGGRTPCVSRVSGASCGQR